MSPNTRNVSILDWICYVLLIIGALNWGVIGLVDVNLLPILLEGVFQPDARVIIERLLYVLVGLAGIYFVYPLYRMARRDDHATRGE